jgi:hypothetical protein
MGERGGERRRREGGKGQRLLSSSLFPRRIDGPSIERAGVARGNRCE